MEEIEYKLKQNNAVSIVQAISKLVEIIKQKKKPDTNGKITSDFNIAELQLLKSKCGVEEPTVSITASHGIISLVEDGILPIGGTISDLMVILSTARCFTGITMAIGNLLLLDVRRELDTNIKYKCQFNLQKPQHPFITILSQNNEIWLEIYNQIQLFINHYDDKIAVNSLELLRPVFFYIMCDPASKLRDISRRQLWSLLIFKDNNRSLTRLLTFDILTWIQMNSKQKCLEMYEFLSEMQRLAIKNENKEVCVVLLLCLASVMHKLVKYGCDPTPCITTIVEMLKFPEADIAHSFILMVLADTVTICPSVYLKEILRLCKLIVRKQSANVLAVKSIVAAILQWLLFPSNLLSDSLKIAHDIILFTDNNQTYASFTGNLFSNSYFKLIQFSNPTIDLLVKLCLIAEKWQTDNKYLLLWLIDVVNASPMFLSNIFTFISAIFIHRFSDSSISLKTLEILLKIVENKIELAPNVLVLILYKLTNERDPDTQAALLKAIPMMAVSKQNIPLIINTLETIKNGPGCLKTLSFNLYFRLWSTEVRCFPYLQKMLLESEDNWEFGIAKANTLKEICLARPELHGKDMVSHLSQVLNKFSDQKGSIASSLALEGITLLCKAGIIDIVSTWKSLSPRFTKDKRPIVIKSLCELLSQYSNLRCVSVQEEEAVNEVIIKLWHYVTHSDNIEVIAAALKALSCFDTEQMTLKQLPDLYRQKLKLPSAYAKTPVDAARKPEDVLPYIPGECWVQMLQNMNHDALENAGDLLIEWVRREIAGYKSGVYNIVVDANKEPVSYDSLPDKSIVRALVNYIRLVNVPNSKVIFSEYTVRQCLRILGHSYTKALPPLHWSFLQEMLQQGAEIHRLCINLVCKQILISGTARRIVENYLSVFEPNIEKSYEMIILFENLCYLCKGIAPNILRPVVLKTMELVYETTSKQNSDCQLFGTLVENITIALKDENIHDANRILLAQIIEVITEQMDANSKEFNIFLPCIIETPSKYVDRISLPSLWWETTQEKLEKAIKIRCALAMKTDKTPLANLNECINTSAILQSVQIYTLKEIAVVFQYHKTHPSISDWLLELMGQIQEKLTNENRYVDEIAYLCDVFLLAVIVFSSHISLYSPCELVVKTREAKLTLFPNAIHGLINERCQHISVQVMEWLYHMVELCTEIPSAYQLAFYHSLIMLRHEKAFYESAKWMKYVSVKRPNF